MPQPSFGASPGGFGAGTSFGGPSVGTGFGMFSFALFSYGPNLFFFFFPNGGRTTAAAAAAAAAIWWWNTGRIRRGSELWCTLGWCRLWCV